MLWGSRLERPPDPLLRRLNDSFRFDRRLYDADIRGSLAYSRALLKAGLLTPSEQASLAEGLSRVRDEFAAGLFAPLPSDEDIHTAVERRLLELIGRPALKLHTGRSRNDQVATDVRLFLLESLTTLGLALRDLQRALHRRAADHFTTLLPGYTHLRRAQPVTFAHYLLSFFWMFQRDRERLRDLRPRAAILPLGSGALAGSPFPLDYASLARDLGFDACAENSLDSVSDRDFLVEFLAAAALTQVHLSRLAEDLILYSSDEFGFVQVDDSYSTGSSLMPQKKNPDSLELLRGKSGRVIGNLTSLLVTLKGLPSAYDKDLQEDKEPLFDTLDTLETCLPVAAGVVQSLQVFPARMLAALDSSMLATDVADYLVLRGMPFREAHSKVGEAVRLAQQRGVPLSALAPSEWQSLAPEFGVDLKVVDPRMGEVFDLPAAVTRKSNYGGTAPDAVRAQWTRAGLLLAPGADPVHSAT